MVSHTDGETQDLASLQICNKSWQVFERVCVGVFTVILFVGFYGMILLNVDYTDEKHNNKDGWRIAFDRNRLYVRFLCYIYKYDTTNYDKKHFEKMKA